MNPTTAPALEIPAPPASEVAVIYVSAASVSLIIGNRGAEQPLEHMDRPLPLARDIFRGGSISRG